MAPGHRGGRAARPRGGLRVSQTLRRRGQGLPASHLRGRAREDPRVRVRGRRDEPAAPRPRGRARGRLRATSSRRRCSPSSTRRRRCAGAVRPRGRHRLRAHGPRRPGVRAGARRGGRRRDHDRGARSGRSPSAAAWASTSSRARSTNQDGETRLHRHVDQHRAGELTMEPGQAAARAEGHARQVPDRPLRGRVGRLQPDPHRRGVRPVGRPARAHPPRPVDDGPGRARADRGGRRARTRSSASRSSSAAWACPSRSSRSRATVQGGRATASRPSRPRRAQGGSRIIRKGGRGRAWADAPLPTIDGVLTPRQELMLRKVVDGFADDRPARGLQGARRRPGRRLRALDDPQRARGARGARAARPPAHLGGARADRRRLPLLRRPPAARSARRRAASRARRAHARAPRGRRGDARDDRDALAGHEPAGDRLRAADRRRRRSATSRCCCCSRRC